MSEAATTTTTDTGTANTGTATTTATTQTGSGVGEPWAKDWIKPDFSLDHKALDRLPDHLKGMRPTLEKYGKFEDALTGWQNQQVMAGKKALAPLPSDAPEASRAERKALLDGIQGVPKEAKDYGIAKPADFPDAQWNPKLVDSFTNWAHKHSVSPQAAKELVFDIQVGAIKSQIAEQEQYTQQFWAKEQQTFDNTIKGQNIASDKAQALVEKGATALGLDLNNPQTKEFLRGSDARLMALRHAIAIGEDVTVTGNSASPTNGRNYEELAKELRADKDGPYWNKTGKYSRSDQDAAIAKHNEYLQLAAAEEAKKQGGRR